MVRVRYQTIEFGDQDIHLRTLRDNQQFDESKQDNACTGVPPAGWAHFGTVWESGEVLARLMHVHAVRGLRVLEVGCGIGLSSLVLRHRGADVTATDHNPEAGLFLAENVELNALAPIRFVRSGWGDALSALGRFDLVIGSDLLYEPDSAQLLGGFIDRHSESRCEVIIVDPGRGFRSAFVKKMIALGFQLDSSLPAPLEMVPAYRGKVLRFSSSDRTAIAGTGDV